VAGVAGLAANRQRAAERASWAGRWPRIGKPIGTRTKNPTGKGAEAERVVVEVVVFIALDGIRISEARRARA
jgi:hypothetical protein